MATAVSKRPKEMSRRLWTISISNTLQKVGQGILRCTLLNVYTEGILLFRNETAGSLMPPLVMKLIFSTMVEKSPFFIRPISSALSNQVTSGYLDPNLKKMFALVDGYLARDGGRKWLAGTDEPTGADFMVSLHIGIYLI